MFLSPPRDAKALQEKAAKKAAQAGGDSGNNSNKKWKYLSHGELGTVMCLEFFYLPSDLKWVLSGSWGFICFSCFCVCTRDIVEHKISVDCYANSRQIYQ